SREVRGERGEHGHEQRCAFGLRRRLEIFPERRGEDEALRLAAERRLLGSRAIEGEGERLGRALKRCFPVREPFFELAALEPSFLPGGPVRVSDRERR